MAGADDQILAAVPVDVDPAQPRTQLAELVRQERLAAVVVEDRIDVHMATEESRGVLEEPDRRGVGRPGPAPGRARFIDLVEAIRSSGHGGEPAVAPSHL